MIDKEIVNLINQNIPFIDKLNNFEKELIYSNSIIKEYQEKDIINKTDCIGLILVLEGSLRTFLNTDDGRNITLFTIQTNEFCILSASCMLDQIDFEVTIEAESNIKLLEISTVVLNKLAKKNIYIELFMYKLLSERFSSLVLGLQQVIFNKLDIKLAHFLIDESYKQKSLIIKITHDKIASSISSTREVVSRMLKRFEKQKIIRLNRGSIEILDFNELKKF